MPETLPEMPENAHENAAFSQDSPQESPEVPQTTTEATKQFPLRLPVAVISDIENVVKSRRLHGEMIETPMYCRYVLENHRKIANYDTDFEKLRRENAALTQRILELQLRDENDVLPASVPSEHERVIKALQAAIKKATEMFAQDGFYNAEYYEAIVSDYYQQILPQIHQ